MLQSGMPRTVHASRAVKREKEMRTMSNATRQDRITTNPGSPFLRCVALPIREETLQIEGMAGYTGGEGFEEDVRSMGAAFNATETIRRQNPHSNQLRELERAAAWGVIATANTDSTRTSFRRVTDSAPGWFDSALDWCGDRLSEGWNAIATVRPGYRPTRHPDDHFRH